MRTTLKPNKSVKKRFKVTATGKLKYQKGNRRHLLSGRSGDMLRRAARPGVLDEQLAASIRPIIGAAGKNPAKIAELKMRAMKAKAAEAEGK